VGSALPDLRHFFRAGQRRWDPLVGLGFLPTPGPRACTRNLPWPWTGLARANLKGRDVTKATPCVGAEGCGVGWRGACTASTARRGDPTDPQTDDVQGWIIGDGIALVAGLSWPRGGWKPGDVSDARCRLPAGHRARSRATCDHTLKQPLRHIRINLGNRKDGPSDPARSAAGLACESRNALYPTRVTTVHQGAASEGTTIRS